MKRWLLILFVFSINLIQAYGTVVCIPGFLVPFRHMCKIENMLNNCHMNACIWSYPSRGCTIEQNAKKLCRILQDYATKHPGEPIDFVAHSVGSLILKAVLNDEECPEEARMGKIVLLAPCTNGSELARRMKNFALIRFVMGNKTGQQLMTFTPEMMDCCFGDFPEGQKILVIAGDKGSQLLFNSTPNDGLLTVKETEIDAPSIRYVLHLDHNELLKDPCALSLIKNFLLFD